MSFLCGRPRNFFMLSLKITNSMSVKVVLFLFLLQVLKSLREISAPVRVFYSDG